MYVDAGSSVGMNRQSGPKGNLWNINKLYNEDGIHFLNEGDRRIALTIVKSIITQTSPVISNININPDKNKITVSWDSDKNTYGKVHYNIYQIPDTSRIAGATKTMQRHHLIEFNKLRSCTSYNVKVDSVINIFNKALSEDINVRTDGCISTQNLMALF
jgi:hypothetical protein